MQTTQATNLSAKKIVNEDGNTTGTPGSRDQVPGNVNVPSVVHSHHLSRLLLPLPGAYNYVWYNY